METYFAPATALDILLQKVAGGGGTPIGTPASIGKATNTNGTGAALAITTSALAAAGALVFVTGVSTSSVAINSIADNDGNAAYTMGASYTGGVNVIRPGYLILPSDLESGDIITVTTASSLGRKLGIAVAVTGIDPASPLDAVAAGATGSTAAAMTITSGTLAHANSIVFAMTYISAGGVDAWTEASGWTSLDSVTVENRILRIAYKIVSATTPVTYAPTNGADRAWAMQLITFKGAA